MPEVEEWPDRGVVLGHKIVRPPPAAAAPSRLLDLVGRTPPGGACVLTTAPGYGKTTVLVDATAGQRAAWVRLDDRDGDARRLWRHVVAAVRASGSDEGRRPARSSAFPVVASVPRQGRSTPRRRPEVDATVDGTLQALDADPPEWIILDGLDRDAHATVLADLAYLLQYLPAGVRVALTARRDLGRCLAEARARGQLVELDEHELALTPAEVAELLDTEDDELVARLTAVTAGWPVAVASAAQQHAVDAGTDLPRWVSWSWAPPVLRPWVASLPRDEAQLLQETSMLDLLHPELCDAVRGSGNSGEVLDALLRDHAHVAPTDQGGELWLARRPLLTAVLRLHATPAAPRTHRRAAAWFAARQGVEPQLKHLIAAGEYQQAQSIVRRVEDEAMVAGRGPALREWYTALPPDALDGSGGALLRLAWSHVVSGEMGPARAMLRRLEALVDPIALLGGREGSETYQDDPPGELTPRRLAAETALLGGWLDAQDGELEAALTRTGRAVELMGGRWRTNGDQLAQVHLAALLVWLGRPGPAGAVLRPLRGRAFATPLIGEVMFPMACADLALREGRLYDGLALVAVARLCLERGEELRELTYERYLAPLDAVLRAERGEVEEAADELATAAMERVVAEESLLHGVRTLVARAQVAHLAGKGGDALRHLTAARRRIMENAPQGGLLSAVDAVEARVRLAAGDVLRAERLVRRLNGEERAVLRARTAVVRSPSTALSMIEACDVSSPRLQVERHVLLAAACLPSTRRAEEHLLAAADLVRDTGLVLALLDMPPQLVELAARTAAREGHDELAALAEFAGRPWQPPASRPDTGLTQALSRGDLELLALLPGRDSNIRLAEQLCVSVNTVKTRLKRLYARLGVHDRDAAIEQARRLGLLP